MRIRKPRKSFGHDSQTGDAMQPEFFNPDMMLFGLDLEDLNRSVEQGWSEYWEAQGLATRYGERLPNPVAEWNPRAEKWCYPNKSLEAFRSWARHEFFGGGKFQAYLDEKVERGEISPVLAAQTLTTILRGARGMGSA